MALNSIGKILFDAGMKPFAVSMDVIHMENDLTLCKLGRGENLYRVLYTYTARIYDKNEIR